MLAAEEVGSAMATASVVGSNFSLWFIIFNYKSSARIKWPHPSVCPTRRMSNLVLLTPTSACCHCFRIGKWPSCFWPCLNTAELRLIYPRWKPISTTTLDNFVCLCVCGMRWPLDALFPSLHARQHFPANSRAMCADIGGKQSLGQVQMERVARQLAARG